VGLVLTTGVAPVAWGTTYAVTTELLPPAHPVFAGLVRALPAGLLALAVTRQLPSGSWWWKATVLGVLNIGAFFPLLFLAAERLPGGVAATLGATQPLVVAGLAVVVLHESPSRWRAGWGVVGVVGVALVVLGPTARLDGPGLVAGLLGALLMALGLTLTKRWGRPPGVGPLTYAGWQLTAGGLVLLPLALLGEGVPAGIDAPAVLGYAWLASIGGLVAYALWSRGAALLPVAATALLGLLSPLVAAALGTLLGERLGPLQLAGFALALTALVAGQLDRSCPGRRTPLR
jgi:probable blue pigment (indigoidine) exporter